MIGNSTMFKAMLGYALWITIEDTVRNWLSRRLIQVFGDKWTDQFPPGIWNKLMEKYNEHLKPSEFGQLRELLEYSDFPDLFDIVKYRKQVKSITEERIETDDLDYYVSKMYVLRNQIAHKPYSFNVRQLDDLVDCGNWVVSFTGSYATTLTEVLYGIEKHPEKYARQIPDEFVIGSTSKLVSTMTHNLPPMDYEYDGGFIGRRQETTDIIKRLLDKRLHPVITISGAGGVGKTALAHYICENILRNHADAFDGLVWISAKKDRLTLTGIEEIEPSARNYEEIINSMLNTFSFKEFIGESLETKWDVVNELMLDRNGKGLLLVIDNLETILHDEQLIEFLKDVPLPNKVLITSRLGLGEIERRVPLKQLTEQDAIALFRTIAIEKSAKNLSRVPNEVISSYVSRMSSYPLVIKWAVGQAAQNMDIERLVSSINATSSDISKFCFEYIYDHMLSENSKILLCCLAASEQEISQAVLMHVAEISVDIFEDTMRELELASLVIPNQLNDATQQKIVTKYGLLPLTRAYLLSKNDSLAEIQTRLKSVQSLVEEGERALKQYQFSLEYLGAKNEEEYIAVRYVQAANNRLQMGDYEGAQEQLQRAIQIAPNFAGVYRNWAVIEGKHFNYEKAVELFQKAISLNPNDATTWFYWGELERKYVKYSDARQYFQKALEIADDKSPALIALGNVEKQDMNYRLAIQYFQQALDFSINGDQITDRSKIIAYTSMAETLRRWAEVYERDQQLNVAIEKAEQSFEVIQKALNLGSSDSKAIEVQLECTYELGRLYIKNKQLERSISILKIASEYQRKVLTEKMRKLYTRLYYQLILVLIEVREFEEATKICSLAVEAVIPTDNIKSKFDKISLFLNEQLIYNGAIAHISPNNDYCFISCKEFARNVFAHISNFVDDVNNDELSQLNGATVTFSTEETEKGLSAKWIKLQR